MCDFGLLEICFKYASNILEDILEDIYFATIATKLTLSFLLPMTSLTNIYSV